jgi:glycosyltransferase involved in cell wall biosynthesis
MSDQITAQAAAHKKIVMLGTAFDTMGGVAAVVNVYRAAGLFARFPILYLATHCDGSRTQKLAAALLAWLRLGGLLLTGQVGLLHVHVASRASFWRKSGFFLLAFAFRVPTILHLHGGGFQLFFEQECGPLRQRFVRYVFNRASRVVVLSGAWKAWVRSISVNPQVEAIYNPVQMPQHTRAWADRTPGQMLFLGRLGKLKGSYDLLQAMAALAPAHRGARLLLGGDGEQQRMQQRAAELSIASQVTLLGWLQGERKEQMLASSMLYVLPSYYEGLPMSILEAMASGIPVLSTTVGGIPEAVTDGVEGFLVAAGDVTALAERMQCLLNDDALAQRMGAAARRKVETTFSAAAVLPQIEALYAGLGFAAK